MDINITDTPHGNARGAIAELAVEALLLSRGWNVGRMNEGCVYDLLAERPQHNVIVSWESKTFRIQVKLAYPRNDYTLKRGTRAGESRMRFNSAPSSGGRKHYEAGDFDYLAVVVAREGVILFIPWTGQFSSTRIVTDDMMAEYQELPR